MKLKLTHSQFTFIYELVKKGPQFCRDFGGEMYNNLLESCLITIQQKCYKQAFLIKKEYRLKLEPHEAIAFYLTFLEHDLPNTSFEGNLLQTVLNQIHHNFQTPQQP